MAENDSLHQIVLTRRESEDIQARLRKLSARLNTKNREQVRLILRSLKRGERRCRNDKTDRKLW